MALAQLTEKIIQDAEKKKVSIIKGAEHYAQTKENETEKLASSKRESFEKTLEERLAQNTEKVTRHAQREAKNLIDKTKRTVLDTVFTESLESLKKASDDAYEKILLSLFDTLPEEKGGILYTKPERVSITKKALDKKGLPYPVEEDANIQDGFVIKGDTFEYDGTFTKLLTEKKRQLEVEVARILFN